MPENLATAVDAARARAFVGREGELACYQAALRGEVEHRVLLVHGPAGLGKTTLLHRYKALGQESGRVVVSLDGEQVGAAQDSIWAAVESARTTGCAEQARPWVLLIDGYERLTALDGWIRDQLVASLPDDVVVVLAGRDQPSPTWRTDPGWRAIAVQLPLEPLDPVQSQRLLSLAGVRTEWRPRLAAMGRGHPLTLAMLASAAGAGTLTADLADDPDLVASLASRLVDEAPDDDHALAMALCAHAWLTTADLVEELLGRRSSEVWTWLETRPWITRGGYGIHPHDLVRDVLDADLRRRSPATYRRVNRLLHDHAWAAMRADDEAERRLWAHQKLFLHRRSPLAVAFWTMRAEGAAFVSAGRPSDHGSVLGQIGGALGAKSATLAERWLSLQPQGLSVVRSSADVSAFAFHAVHPAEGSPEDPVARAVLDYVADAAPPRPGELVSIARFLGGRGDNERDAYAVVVGCVSSTMLWTTQPLAWSFVATTDPEFWTPMFDYLAFSTRFSADFDGHRYALFGLDWRRLSPDRWFELMGERELTGEYGPAPARLLRPAPLSRTAFDEAVRSALRDLHRDDLLGASPLLGSRLGTDVDGPSPALLRRSLTAGIDQIAREPRTAPLARVLDRSFLHAAPTQEAAAEVLDLPFSTYRRHLVRGLDRLTDLLWSVEIGDTRLPL